MAYDFPTDLFFRSAVFPNFLKKELFDRAALMSFSPLDGRGRGISLAGWDKCGNLNEVHDFGLKLEVTKNDRYFANNGHEPPEGKRQHYLGSYAFRARRLKCALLHTQDTLRHDNSEGDERHYQYELHPLSDNVTEREIKSDERIARKEMSDLLFGPELLPNDVCCDRKKELQKLCMQEIKLLEG